MTLKTVNDVELIAVAKHELQNIPSLMRRARCTLSDLRSMTFDGMPHAKNTRNHNEDQIVKQLDAKQELAQIKQSIELCEPELKEILTARYMNLGDVFDTQVFIVNTHTTVKRNGHCDSLLNRLYWTNKSRLICTS